MHTEVSKENPTPFGLRIRSDDILRHIGLEDWVDCQRCPLHRTRRKVALYRDCQYRPLWRVPGATKVPRRISLLLLGEGPGEVEDATGKPFTGPSRVPLHYLLQYTATYSNCIIYFGITNVVGCRPTAETKDQYHQVKIVNRQPTPEEIESCTPHLNHFWMQSKTTLASWPTTQTPSLSSSSASASCSQSFASNSAPCFSGVIKLGRIADSISIPLPTIHTKHPAYYLRQEFKVLELKKSATEISNWIKTLTPDYNNVSP